MLEFNDGDNGNPFDPKALRLSNKFGDTTGVKKLLTKIPVGKPSAQTWFRVHPDEDYRLNIGIIELKEDNEIYAVSPAIYDEISDLVVPATLYSTMSRQGVFSFWRVRLPGPDGKNYDAWGSAHDAASRAMNKWTRVQWNPSLSAYDIYEASGISAEPEWPEMPLANLLKIAFEGWYIETPDHPLILKLRGQA